MIRSYTPVDRATVRKICCDVAVKGEAIETVFPDRVIAADLLTMYYTDYEPESTLVAEDNGRVVGYINGALDGRRHGLALIFLILPKFVLKGIWRGVFARPEFWRLCQGASRNLGRLVAWRKSGFHSHVAHLHIGIERSCTGKGVGKALVQAMETLARASGVKSLTASVHGNNDGARRFFESCGFAIAQRHPMVEYDGKGFVLYEGLVYAKTI